MSTTTTTTFLYTVSNICIPMLILSYLSLNSLLKSNQVPYGNWTILSILISLGYVTHWYFEDDWLYLLVDLLIKCAVCVLPKNVIVPVEQIICNLHLQVILDEVRCQFINKIWLGVVSVLESIVGKLESGNKGERERFIDGVIQRLEMVSRSEKDVNNGSKTVMNHQKQKHHVKGIIAQPKSTKTFNNYGVNCNLISQQLPSFSDYNHKIEDLSIKAAKMQAHLKQKSKASSELKKIDPKNSSAKITSTKVKQQMPKFTYTGTTTLKNTGTNEKRIDSSKNRPKIDLQQSQQTIHFSDDDDQNEDPISPIFNPIGSPKASSSNLKGEKNSQKKSISRKIDQQSEFRRADTMKVQGSTQEKKLNTNTIEPSAFVKHHTRQSSKIVEFFDEPQQQPQEKRLLQKLDVSVSQYSDMFDDDDENFAVEETDPNTPICKVQAIVQIGVSTSARLQVYNVELYADSTFRIVSLYNREFQKHTLLSMRALPNNYYELQLKGGKVKSRKIKFRGQHQPFMKYVQK